MSFSTTVKKATKRLIDKFGSSITLTEVVKGIYDPITGETVDVKTPHIINGLIEEYKSSEIIPNVIDIEDLRVMLYASDFALNKSWTVTHDSKEWKIINLSKLNTQNTLVYYELQIRSA